MLPSASLSVSYMHRDMKNVLRWASYHEQLEQIHVLPSRLQIPSPIYKNLLVRSVLNVTRWKCTVRTWGQLLNCFAWSLERNLRHEGAPISAKLNFLPSRSVSHPTETGRKQIAQWTSQGFLCPAGHERQINRRQKNAPHQYQILTNLSLREGWSVSRPDTSLLAVFESNQIWSIFGTRLLANS